MLQCTSTLRRLVTITTLVCAHLVLKHAYCFVAPTSSVFSNSKLFWSRQNNNDCMDSHGKNASTRSYKQRALLSLGLIVPLVVPTEPALAATGKKSYFFLMKGKESTAQSEVEKQQIKVETNAISSELCLLRLLPVKNKIFRALEKKLESISALRTSQRNNETWNIANETAQYCLELVDTQRGQLKPVYNPEDSTTKEIMKGERGETKIGAFREDIVELIAATEAQNETATFCKQRDALLALSEIGELMVRSFPYNIPEEDKFAYLPRLLGRSRITITFKRGKSLLGNVTIVADGYVAPITAGNFVDLCVREFYTGLTVKTFRKRLGAAPSILTDGGFLGLDIGLDPESLEAEKNALTVLMPILGSFREGFYDPLTAKPRRIPLEILRLDKKSGLPELSYSRSFFNLPSLEASLDAPKNNKPVLSFNIPGLVGSNHPDKNVNGGSSEFFVLEEDDQSETFAKKMDGEYAPFGFVVGGYDLYQSLRPGDVIEATTVDTWGVQNLVRIKKSSF